MGLTKEQRDRLPDSEFAVPGQRKLPIHDKQHIVLAWTAADTLRGDERLQAKRAILRKAHTLGVDTKTWHLSSSTLTAMALDFGENRDHSNRQPFTGVLTFLDVPSDNPVGGTGGKRVIMTRAAAEEALHSLLGMAIDFTPDFDGHAPTRKIGLITGADVEQSELKIAGFFWAADYPEEVALILRDKDKLGFSYECRSLFAARDADPLVTEAVEFTGAAVLYKDKAAYMKTSLAARADQSGETKMDKDLQDALTAMATSIASIPATVATAVTTALKANTDAETKTRVDAAKANAATLRTSAASLKAQGIHTAATALEAEAAFIESYTAKNEVPPPYVPGTVHAPAPQQTSAAADITAAMKPMTDAIASMATTVTDLAHKVGTGQTSQQQQRKTLSAASTALLAKTGLKLDATANDGKIKVADLDAAAQKANLQSHESLALKLTLKDAGLLADA